MVGVQGLEYSPGEYVTQFRDFAAAQGLVIPGTIVDDGNFHHFPVGPRRCDPSGYYRYHADGVPNGIVGDFRTGAQAKWVAQRSGRLTGELRRQIGTDQRARDEKRQRAREDAAERARTMFADAEPATDDHPYLVEKQVRSYGLKCGTWKGVGNTLFIPIRDSSCRIVSLQGIFPDERAFGRRKEYLKDGQKQGGYFTIGGLTYIERRPAVAVVEGYATGASVHAATGLCTAVAFDRGNLLDVARTVRWKLPNAMIVLAGDNDRWTAGNPGKTDAETAASAVGGICVAPEFKTLEGQPTDFNDLQVREGADKVRDQIMATLADAAPMPLSAAAELDSTGQCAGAMLRSCSMPR